jgi:hypothetical protein
VRGNNEEQSAHLYFKVVYLTSKRCHKINSGWIKAETMPQDKDDKSPEEGGTLYTALKTGPSAPVQSSTTTSSADTSEDDLHHDSDIARSSGGGGGTTASTSPAEVEEAQATSRKKRKHDHGDRFSFREPFLYKVSSSNRYWKLLVNLGLLLHLTYPRLWSLLLPLQLRLMLDNETNADSGSIRWLDNEDAFVILDQNKFEKVCGELISLFYVLPLFEHASYTESFAIR